MKKILSLLIWIVLIAFNMGGDVDELYTLVPEGIKGWIKIDKDEIFDRDTLFDYMNGGAEIYLAFDFRQVFVRRYSGPGENEIVLDIYDMGSSSEAFGIFSCDREDEEIGIGQGSEFGPGLLRFWKDKYFVSIIAMGNEEQTKSVMIELSKAIEQIIPDKGSKPEILKTLPQQGLINESISYFHSVVNLNNRFFIASENILQLSDKTDCVFAEYSESEQEKTYLMIVHYETEEKAQTAFKSFLYAYMPESIEDAEFRTNDGLWTVARQKRNKVSIVFEAAEKETALKLLEEIKF